MRSLGDCVLTTPALELLKAHRPDLEIGMVVEDRFRGLFEDHPHVHKLLEAVPKEVAAWQPALVLNLHGGMRSMTLTLAARARHRAGFAHHRYSFVYTARIPRAQQILQEERPVHTAEHLASAVFWLGVPRAPIPRARLAAGPPPRISERGYAVIHPFASQPDKTWPAERFVEVALHLRDVCGLEPVFLAGPGDVEQPFEQFQVWRNAPTAEVKSLMSGAQLFVGNDSGPAHIAAAFGVPVVVLFGSSDPVTWAPWRTEARVLTAPEGIASIDAARVIASLKVAA